jgi:hypothetical protein
VSFSDRPLSPALIPNADVPVPLPVLSGVKNAAARATKTKIRYVQASDGQPEPRPHIPLPTRESSF